MLLFQSFIVAQNDATIVETVDWIKAKVDGIKFTSRSIDGASLLSDEKRYSYYYHSQSIQFNRDNLMLFLTVTTTNSMKIEGRKVVFKLLYEVPLKKMNYGQINVGDKHEWANYISITIYAFNNQKVIKVNSSCSYEDNGENCDDFFEGNTVQYVDRVKIDVSPSDELPERLKKAFEHLVVKCGGKKEKF